MPDAIPRWRPPHQRGLKPAKERAHYTSADWIAKRQRILVRDAFTCRSCSTICYGKDAHVDHIVPLEDGGDDHSRNLQTLCASCHGRKTRDEQRAKGFVS